MPADRDIEFLRELERADEKLGAWLAALEGLAHEVEEIGARASALSERLERLPEERAAAATARAEAEREVEARRAEHQAVLAAGYGDEAEARREEIRARDLLHSAERRLDAEETIEARLGEEADASAREALDLAERAAQAGVDSRAGTSLEAIAAWATETRAALFVRRAQLAAEREAVIRQANELGSSLLGEPLVAQSAALVARRVEESRH
jgi:hypothetical protein